MDINLPYNNPTSRYLPRINKNICPHEDFYRNVKSSMLITARKWKPSKLPSTKKWTNKMWYLQTLVFYSEMKKHKLQINVSE